MIRIVNWLLTRKCNLNCDYCAIVKDYHGKPAEYPDMKHYRENQMGTTSILNALARFQEHNPQCFHIFYGGEPLLRNDLAEILQFCHRHAIHYTVISNNTREIAPLLEKLVNQVRKLKGYTASIDPILVDEDTTFSDRLAKTRAGFETLLWMREYCDDVVAEITIMNEDKHLIHKLVQFLSKCGINSDITFVDIAKTEYYDFSNVRVPGDLVYKSPELAYQMMNILTDDDLDIHMKEYLIPATYKILPSDMDCEIEKDLHNVTIDADGSVRLCLRIRGVNAPENIHMNNLIDSEGYVNPIAHKLIVKDKVRYCQGCNHTCHLMSKYLNDHNLEANELVHLDRRK